MKAENRFYWIKLKTDFFDQDVIDFLLLQENGCKYIVLYQMICLKAVNNDGEMYSKFGEVIVPYDVKKIMRDTKYFDFDTITVALDLFKRLGLIYKAQSGIFKISNIENMVGSEAANANAQRQKRYRERQKQKRYREKQNMVDNAVINVNAQRQKRYRERKKLLEGIAETSW